MPEARSATMPTTGSSLGRFRLGDILGSGGMGVVYKAWDSTLERHIALKILLPEANFHTEHRLRFLQEAKAASALNHPNIITIHDIGRDGEVDFIAMELVEGCTLEKKISEGPIPLPETLNYALQISDAMHKAHGAGILHRDLKPSNLMITREGHVKILDFGLAKWMSTEDRPWRPQADTGLNSPQAPFLTVEGKLVGTLAYMAPEQAQGEPADARSEIFSLGLILFEMLTGAHPFAGNSYLAMITALTQGDLIPLRKTLRAMGPEVEKLVMRCLCLYPWQRWQSMGELKSALESCDSKEGTAYSLIKQWKRRIGLSAKLVFSYSVSSIREKALAILVLVLSLAALALRQSGFRVPYPVQIHTLLLFGGALCALGLFRRLWKQTSLPSASPMTPVPNAIKGLLPFTRFDGELFFRLGRNIELQQLLVLARNEQVAISVVRGQSGAGKTSILQAGLAYTLGPECCIYWEAVPSNTRESLLYVLRSHFPALESLDELPAVCNKRCVLILDQFEQLSKKTEEHLSIFALLERIARSPAPHKLSAVVAFRREYTPDWMDFEQSIDFRSEQVPINLLAPSVAGSVLTTLSEEAGFVLESALVGHFIDSVKGPDGVSPVDIAIGILSISNFAQQSGKTLIGMAEYKLAGGAEGLLLSFVQQKLDEIPEAVRSPLLKGIVLALVDLSSSQRIAEGAVAADIAAKAEMAESVLLPWLERLRYPRMRLLEKLGEKYRLPHERLVPILTRLAGFVLVTLDQLKLLFEGEFRRWSETHSKKNLLVGKDLKKVIQNRNQFVQGENIAAKNLYLKTCVKRRNVLWLETAGLCFVLVIAGHSGRIAWHKTLQKQNMEAQGLPSKLMDWQHTILELDLKGAATINDLSWLASKKLEALKFKDKSASLMDLMHLTGLKKLDLQFEFSNITSLKGLDRLKQLTSLILDLRSSVIKSFAALEYLDNLKSLTLDMSYQSEVETLIELSKVKNLVELKIVLCSNSQNIFNSLGELSRLQNLSVLEIKSYGFRIDSLDKIIQFKNLKKLSLDFVGSKIQNLAPLTQLRNLETLELGLDNSQITSLRELKQLQGLRSLSVKLSRSKIKDLDDLKHLSNLSSLILDISNSQIRSLVPLSKLKGLKFLKLKQDDLQLANLNQLKALKAIPSIFLDLQGSRIQSLEGLGQLNGLESLVLNLQYSRVKSLKGLEQLGKLTSLDLILSASRISSLIDLAALHGLKSLDLNLDWSLVNSLGGLENLKALSSLKLKLQNPNQMSSAMISSLAPLVQLKALGSLEIHLPSDLVQEFSKQDIKRGTTKLYITCGKDDPLEIPLGCQAICMKI